MKQSHTLFTHLLASFLLSVGAFNSYSQATPDTLRRRFDSFRQSHLQEKLYVHTDQEVYLTGETLWFKIYGVDGSLHKPLEISKIVYVEILDRDNHAVLQAKVGLDDGFGNGSLFLPASLPSGNYWLRAYTNWMRNFSPEFYFQKSLSVINPFQKLENQKVTVTPTLEGHFFPEGGNIIEGVKNKIAFRVNDTNGLGVEFTGHVMDQKNDTIVSFRPFKFGIGSFVFTPLAGNQYRAIIIDKKNRQSRYNLPEVRAGGYGLHLEEAGDEIRLSILQQTSSAFSKNVYLFIHARQQVSRAQVISLQGNETVITIKKGNLLEGISHITLFDESMRPVCERLFYKESEKQLKIEPSAVEDSYSVRSKVTLEISTRNPKDELNVSNLSVAVAKNDSLAMEPGTISSYLWLTSELRGRVESPEYYADTRKPEVREALDNLMLTHGWRRFTWEEVLSTKRPPLTFIPEYRGHFINGIVKDLSGAPVVGVETYIAAPGKNILLRGTRSNKQGEVHFEMRNFVGANKIMAQTHAENDSLFKIEILNPFSQALTAEKLPPYYLSPATENQLLNRSVGMQVQDVFYKDKSERFSPPAIDSSAFYGKVDEAYMLDDYTRFPVMEEVMREYVKGVFVRKRKDKFHYMVLDKANNEVLREDPLILLDGLPIFDVDKIMAFDPLKVKRLEIVSSRYFMGPLIFTGIVSYSTYNGDLGGFQLNPKTVVLDYEGLQLHQEFYSPQYESSVQKESRLPDRRNLLFWAPNVITSTSGKSKLEFYTSDVTGVYSVRIEGLSAEGNAGSKVVTFTVK